MKNDLCNLSAEVTGISRIITGLSNQLDSKKSDVLTCDSMSSALFGLASYLDRIAGDLEEMAMKK